MKLNHATKMLVEMERTEEPDKQSDTKCWMIEYILVTMEEGQPTPSMNNTEQRILKKNTI